MWNKIFVISRKFSSLLSGKGLFEFDNQIVLFVLETTLHNHSRLSPRFTTKRIMYITVTASLIVTIFVVAASLFYLFRNYKKRWKWRQELSRQNHPPVSEHNNLVPRLTNHDLIQVQSCAQAYKSWLSIESNRCTNSTEKFCLCGHFEIKPRFCMKQINCGTISKNNHFDNFSQKSQGTTSTPIKKLIRTLGNPLHQHNDVIEALQSLKPRYLTLQNRDSVAQLNVSIIFLDSHTKLSYIFLELSKKRTVVTNEKTKASECVHGWKDVNKTDCRNSGQIYRNKTLKTENTRLISCNCMKRHEIYKSDIKCQIRCVCVNLVSKPSIWTRNEIDWRVV